MKLWEPPSRCVQFSRPHQGSDPTNKKLTRPITCSPDQSDFTRLLVNFLTWLLTWLLLIHFTWISLQYIIKIINTGRNVHITFISRRNHQNSHHKSSAHHVIKLANICKWKAVSGTCSERVLIVCRRGTNSMPRWESCQRGQLHLTMWERNWMKNKTITFWTCWHCVRMPMVSQSFTWAKCTAAGTWRRQVKKLSSAG